MSLETSTSKVTFQGNDSTTVFPYTFIIPTSDDAVVTLLAADGTPTVLTTQYTISGLNDPNGGNVTYPVTGSPLATGASLTLQRIVPYTQTTVLTNQGGYYPDVVEDADDKIVMQTQQLAEEFGRAIRYPAVDVSPNPDLPAAVLRAGKYLAFDASGNAVVSAGTGADTALRADLATNNGTTLLGWLRNLVGAVKVTLYSWLGWQRINVKEFGAVGDGVTDDTAAINAACISSREGDLYFPRGVYLMSTGTLDVNLDTYHRNIIGEDWTNTFIRNTSGRAAVYVHGTGLNAGGLGQWLPLNASWITIKNISIGSTVGHAVEFYRAGENSRMKNVFLFSAAATKSLLYGRAGPGVMEFNNIRFGGGNMLTGAPYDPPSVALWSPGMNYGLHAIDLLSNDTGLITELHFTNCQGHFALQENVLIEEAAVLRSSIFNINFTDCQFKTSGAYAAYRLKGLADITFTDCFSEDGGSNASMVLMSGGATARMTNCIGANCGVRFDLSVAGANTLISTGGDFYSLTTTGSTGTATVLAINMGLYLATTVPVIGTNCYSYGTGAKIPLTSFLSISKRLSQSAFSSAGINYSMAVFPGGLTFTGNETTGAASEIIENAYRSGANYVRIDDGPVTYMALGNGGINMLSAPTGTAGTTASFTQFLKQNDNGNLEMGMPSLSTTASSGFAMIPTCAGTPTGVPTTAAGMAHMVIDSTNHRFYFYDGTWRNAGP